MHTSRPSSAASERPACLRKWGRFSARGRFSAADSILGRSELRCLFGPLSLLSDHYDSYIYLELTWVIGHQLRPASIVQVQNYFSMWWDDVTVHVEYKFYLRWVGVTEWHGVLVQKSELLHIWRSHLTRISQPKLLSLLSDSLWFIYIFGADMTQSFLRKVLLMTFWLSDRSP